MKVGNAPCSFGVMSGFQPDPPLTYLDVLDQIAEAGYAGSELGDWGFMPADPGVLLPDLEVRGLAMVGAFTPVELTDRSTLDASIAAALRAARVLSGCSSPQSEPGPHLILAADASRHPNRRLVAGRVHEGRDGLADDEWTTLTQSVERIAREVLGETGVATVFHPHCGTPVETLMEAVRFAEMTDPGLVGLCFDTGHVAYAGDDLFAWLSLLAPRTSLVHFKDMDAEVAAEARTVERDYSTAVREGLFCPLGEGGVDFALAYRALADAYYEGWIVVEDEMPPGRVPPLEAAKRDRAFLRGIGL